jgi:DNA-binding phage protein
MGIKMKQYRVIVTELHSAEYHVEAESADEAHTKVVLGYEDCVESFYNETMKDRDDAYIVEMKED